MEVVDLPLFDVQFNDAVVTKMSLQTGDVTHLV